MTRRRRDATLFGRFLFGVQGCSRLAPTQGLASQLDCPPQAQPHDRDRQASRHHAKGFVVEPLVPSPGPIDIAELARIGEP